MSAPSNANTSGLRDVGLSETYRFAYESIRNGAPGLSDATCAAIARSINMKVSLSKTDCATPTDALRLVPVEPTEAMLQEGVKAAQRAEQTCVSWPEMALFTYRAMLAAAPASPLPGGGWKPSRNDVARRCDPKAWEFYDRHIDNPIMGAECRAEVAASIRMADAILALPAAPTGDPK